MGRHPRLQIGRETLLALYDQEGLTIEEIASRLGVSYYGVWKAMERHGIPRRPRARKLAHLNTKEKLEQALLDAGTAAALAKRLKVNRQSLTRLMKKLGVDPWEVRRRGRGGT